MKSRFITALVLILCLAVSFVNTSPQVNVGNYFYSLTSFKKMLINIASELKSIGISSNVAISKLPLNYMFDESERPTDGTRLFVEIASTSIFNSFGINTPEAATNIVKFVVTAIIDPSSYIYQKGLATAKPIVSLTIFTNIPEIEKKLGIFFSPSYFKDQNIQFGDAANDSPELRHKNLVEALIGRGMTEAAFNSIEAFINKTVQASQRFFVSKQNFSMASQIEMPYRFYCTVQSIWLEAKGIVSSDTFDAVPSDFCDYFCTFYDSSVGRPTLFVNNANGLTMAPATVAPFFDPENLSVVSQWNLLNFYFVRSNWRNIISKAASLNPLPTVQNAITWKLFVPDATPSIVIPSVHVSPFSVDESTFDENRKRLEDLLAKEGHGWRLPSEFATSEQRKALILLMKAFAERSVIYPMTSKEALNFALRSCFATEYKYYFTALAFKESTYPEKFLPDGSAIPLTWFATTNIQKIVSLFSLIFSFQCRCFCMLSGFLVRAYRHLYVSNTNDEFCKTTYEAIALSHQSVFALKGSRYAINHVSFGAAVSNVWNFTKTSFGIDFYDHNKRKSTKEYLFWRLRSFLSFTSYLYKDMIFDAFGLGSPLEGDFAKFLPLISDFPKYLKFITEFHAYFIDFAEICIKKDMQVDKLLLPLNIASWLELARLAELPINPDPAIIAEFGLFKSAIGAHFSANVPDGVTATHGFFVFIIKPVLETFKTNYSKVFSIFQTDDYRTLTEKVLKCIVEGREFMLFSMDHSPEMNVRLCKLLPNRLLDVNSVFFWERLYSIVCILLVTDAESALRLSLAQVHPYYNTNIFTQNSLQKSFSNLNPYSTAQYYVDNTTPNELYNIYGDEHVHFVEFSVAMRYKFRSSLLLSSAMSSKLMLLRFLHAFEFPTINVPLQFQADHSKALADASIIVQTSVSAIIKGEATDAFSPLNSQYAKIRVLVAFMLMSGSSQVQDRNTAIPFE